MTTGPAIGPDRPLGEALSSMLARPLVEPSSQDAYARLKMLNELLLTRASATIALEGWCRIGHVPDGSVTVERVTTSAQPIEKPTVLHGSERSIRYRRVRLRYADCVLSVAENWYCPDSLTPEMNALLDTTDISFGRIVRPLEFRRRTISAELLWHPDTDQASLLHDPAAARTTGMELPDFVLRHRAFLILPDGSPFSEVVETYKRAVLTFEPESTGA